MDDFGRGGTLGQSGNGPAIQLQCDDAGLARKGLGEDAWARTDLENGGELTGSRDDRLDYFRRDKKVLA